MNARERMNCESFFLTSLKFSGLYPPVSNEIWNKKILWQPVPIHITPVSQDIVVNMNACPKLQVEANLITQTRAYKEIEAKYGDYFQYISENSGELVNFTSIYPLFDTLFSEMDLHLTLPDWVEKVFSDMVSLAIKYTKLDSMTTTEKKIQIGPLLTRIVSQFNRAISGQDFGTTKTIYRKYMTYFTTEWIMFDLTYALGLPSINIPNFGAVYLIELRRKPAGEYYVNILFRHSPTRGTRAVRLAIQGEKTNLEYGRFKELVNPFMTDPKEWKALCESFSNSTINLATHVPMS